MTDTGYRLTPVDYNPFEGPVIEKIAPATEPQKEIFVSTLIGEADANRAYNESFSLLFNGALNTEVFHEAFAALQQRHESLRTTISGNGEKVVVFQTPGYQLSEKDISQLAPEAQQTWLQQLAANEADTIIDIVKGPLFRAHLIKINDSSWQFTLTGHHIMFDGWSLGILLQDLGKLYSAFAQKQIPHLTTAIQFTQYASEQSIFEKTAGYNAIKTFWVSQFSNKIPDFEFPTDFVRPTTRTYKSHRNDYQIPPLLCTQLKQTAQKNNTSFITLLIAAFEVFLHKASGQNEVIFALPTAGQSTTGDTHLIGHCVNTLPIRSQVDAALPFTTYLKRRKLAILDCYENQQITFGSLLKAINIPRNPSKVTLVPVSFNVDLGMTNDVHFEGLSYQLVNNPRHYETFDFFLNASGSENEMTFEWSYNTNLFKADTIQKLHHYLQLILQVITSNPDTLIKDITSPDNTAANIAYEELNNTSKVYPSDKTVDQLITATAIAFPTSTAVIFDSEKLTYNELEAKANQFANYLVQKGINRGDTVGLALDRSIHLPVVFLGVSKAGAIFQPIDPAYPLPRINYILEDGEAKLLITSIAYKDRFETDAEIVFIENIISELLTYDSLPPVIERSGNDIVYILHTSGSTGKPKGVLIEHKNLVNLLLAMQYQPGLQAQDKLLSFTSISFDIFYLELFLPLITGATMVMINSPASKDAREIIACILQEKITVVQTTPSVWNSLLEISGNTMLAIKAISGGEALSKELARKILGKVNELWNVYGPTEATIWASVKKVLPEEDTITIGKPIFNTRFYLLDEYKRLMPPSKTGEIYIAGENVARGYLNLPELTARKFLPDSISLQPGQRMYQTGDIGRLLDNGEIQCLGRVDQQLKINGFRIEPQEIEQGILLTNPYIKQVVVTPISIQKNILLLAAYYTIEPGGEILDSNTWKQRLRMHLPNYMIPDHYIVLDKFPLTPNGKVDKKQLQVPAHLLTATAKSQPATATEIIVKNIWADALQNNDIGLDDDFFDIGGHSLIAAHVMQKIEAATGKKLPLTTLFESATIRSLAAAADSKQIVKTPYKSLVPINTNGHKTPLFLVHGAGLNVLMFYPLAKHLDEDQPLYGLQALGLDGSDIKASTIEGLASFYNKELLEAVQSDEYAIIGYSMGGIIAFEMAKQLKAIGKKVTMLGAIDSYIDNEDYRLPPLQRYAKKIWRQPKKLAFIVQSLFSNPAEAIRYQAYISKEKIKSIIGKVKPEVEELSLEGRINKHYEEAYLKYRLTPYNDTLYLFKVNKRIYYVDDTKYLGWKRYAPKGLVVRNVEGDHKTFLLPPHDEVFAHILQKMLNKIAAAK